MKIRIESNRPELQEDFCEYLIKEIQTNLVLKLMNRKDAALQAKLKLFEEYINSETFSLRKNVYGQKELDLKTILVQGALNLKYMKTKEVYFILINPNAIIPGTFIHIETLCKLVDSGNLDIEGTRLFTKTFEEIEENIQRYIDLYLMEEKLV